MADGTLFDSKAETYDSWYTTPLGAYQDELERSLMFRHIGDVRDKTVLDAGCGTGLYSIRLAEGGADVTAADVSAKMLDIARAKSQDRNLYIWYDQTDIKELPYDDETFDLVVSVNVLGFIENPLEALKELARVLRRGGKIVVGILNSDSPYADVCREQARQKESVYRSAHFMSSSGLRLLFHRASAFGALSMESCVHITPTKDFIPNATTARNELLGRLFRPLTGAFLVGAARKR